MAESALERELSRALMSTGSPSVRELDVGDVLTTQGEAADELFVVLDGMLAVEVDRTEVGDVGPGAVVGERALLEGGARTATLRAITAAKVAAVSADAVDHDALRDLTVQHRREDT
jgi:CRP-like cAMP-binding protein